MARYLPHTAACLLEMQFKAYALRSDVILGSAHLNYSVQHVFAL
jgi:hypothetical protein